MPKIKPFNKTKLTEEKARAIMNSQRRLVLDLFPQANINNQQQRQKPSWPEA